MEKGDQIKTLSERLQITANVAERLIDAGFHSVDSLRGAKSTDLKMIEGIGETTAERIIDKVKNLILESENQSLQAQLMDNGKPLCFGNYPKPEKVSETCRWCSVHVDCKAKQ